MIPGTHVRFTLIDGSTLEGRIVDTEIDDLDTGKPCVEIDAEDGNTYCVLQSVVEERK